MWSDAPDLSVPAAEKLPGPAGRVPASIIIVTYNAGAYLDSCLQSLAGELSDDDEVIVVDNHSTDDSADRVASHFPEVKLVRNAENYGFAVACNQGAALAEGEVLVFLNQDTRVEAGWLAPLVEAVQEEGVGLATSRVLLMSKPAQLHLAGQNVHYTGLVFGWGFMEDGDRWDKPRDVAAVSGASFAVRRELWEALGGFDETFYMYYEDTDLSWRAWLAGYRCRYVPGSRLQHDYHPGEPGRARLYYSNRNRMLLLLKNLHWRTLLLLLPCLSLVELLEWALAAAHGKVGVAAKWQANLWLLKHHREIKRVRTLAQCQRLHSDAVLLRQLSPQLSPHSVMGGRAGRVTIALANIVFNAAYEGLLALWARTVW